MPSRTMTRFAAAGWLALTAALAPAFGQTPATPAPPPRPVTTELTIPSLSWSYSGPTECPAPRPVTQQWACPAQTRVVTLTQCPGDKPAAGMCEALGLRIVVPQLGANTCAAPPPATFEYLVRMMG